MTNETRQSKATTVSPGASRIGMAIRILNVRLRFILLMVLVGVVASQWDNLMNHWDRWRRPHEAAAAAMAEAVEFFCPMHPSVVRDSAGNCPICGMPLSQRDKRSGPAALPEGVLAQVQMTPLKIELGRIGTSPVDYRLLGREVRTIGQIESTETLRAFVAARFKGRADKLMVNFTGQQVRKGDPMAEMYSPDLLVAEGELLQAAKARDEEKDPTSANAQTAQALLDAARNKLVAWGLTKKQIDEIIKRGTPADRVVIESPASGTVIQKLVLEGQYVSVGQNLYTIADLGRVWMQAKVFETDLAGIHEGLSVLVTARAYADEAFAGRVTFMAYSVDPETDTLNARIEIENPDSKLKPGMIVNACIRLPVGEVVDASPDSQPSTAAASAAETKDAALAYLAVSQALAADKTDAAAVEKMAKAAEKLADELPAAKPLAERARRLENKSIDEQRDLFEAVSAALIELLHARPPQGLTLFIFHCPMVEADWLATSKEVVNPYMGSKMLACGELTGRVEAGSASDGTSFGGRLSADRRYAFGYFCPVYPDRLYEDEAQCPIDKFPFKFVKAERILSVPESAVIDTGTRKIVYRERLPGCFDMLEVKVGARAGEFYPVVEGLKEGDKVATAGAFLVDAENRLNPAASVQYFGATGAPHQH